MAPQVTSAKLEQNTPPKYLTRPSEIDYTKINLWNKEDWLKARIKYVDEQNEPIKAKIDEGHKLIDESNSKLATLKKIFKEAFGEEKEGLKKLIRAEKNNLWALCCRNCRLAFSLKRI